MFVKIYGTTYINSPIVMLKIHLVHIVCLGDNNRKKNKNICFIMYIVFNNKQLVYCLTVIFGLVAQLGR